MQSVIRRKYPSDSIGTLVEIPYTEERAKFFYDLILGMCKLGDKFSVLENKDAVLELADKGQALLTEK